MTSTQEGKKWFESDDSWGELPDWADGNGNEDVDEDALSSGNQGFGAQHAVVLLDCHAQMFDQTADQENTAMDAALQSVSFLLQDRIRTTATMKTGKRDGVGILLYNTKSVSQSKHDGENSNENRQDAAAADGDEEHDYEFCDGPSVHELIPLAPPGSKAVKTIRSFLSEERNMQREFMPSEKRTFANAPLQDALTEAKRAFTDAKCVKKNYKTGEAHDSKTIYIITNRENPYPEKKVMIESVAKMLQNEENIKVVLVPVSAGGGEDSSELSFDDIFYETIANVKYFAEPVLLENVEDTIGQLLQDFKKPRRAFHSRILLPGDSNQDKEVPSMDVNWYKFVQPQTKPAQIPIDQSTRQEALKSTQYLGDGGRVIFKKTSDMTTEDKARMRYFYEDKEKKKGADVQRFRVPMGSLAELAAHRTKNNDNAKFASLKFFGFRPIEDFSVLDSCGPAYMIHPTDEIVAGSKDAFLHLHASMLRKKVMAIGEKVLRVSWSSKLVAVVPMDDTETPVMMVVDLPFEDDVRVLEPDYSMQEQALATVKDEMSEKVEEDPYSNHLIGSIGSAQLVEAAKTLIDYQKFPEEMNVEDEFENTALQKFYNYLESVALEMPAKDVHDPYANISLPEGVEEEIQRFASFLPEDVKPLKVKTESKKRKNVQEDTSGIDWHDRFETGTIGKCKNGELQSFLRSIGEKTGGNKSVLVERVESYLAANPVKRVKVED